MFKYQYIFILFLAVFLFSNTIKAQLTADFIFDKTPADYCAGDTVKLSNTTSGTFTAIYWDFGDGTDTWEINNPKHIYQSGGSYTVTIRLYYPGGSVEASKDVNINPSPEISLSNDETTKTLSITSDDPELTYTWFFGKLQTGETDASIYYFESGTYKVVATNSYQCSDSASIEITVGGNTETENNTIIVKNNILTPDNQDGINDVLYIDGLANYSSPCIVEVYNRWGQLVYSNTNYTNLGGFMGKSDDGKDLDAGTYYYVVKSAQRKGGTGFIDIIR